MKVDIYGIEYTIKEVAYNEFYDNLNEKDKDDDNILLGKHLSITQEILLNKDLQHETKKRTLIHEIVHAIIFVLGYDKPENIDEFICDFVAAHHTVINDIINQWEKEE